MIRYILIAVALIVPYESHCLSRYYSFSSFFDWSSGEGEALQVWSPGGIGIAARVDSILLEDEGYIWALCPVPKVALFIGTGGDGRIYRFRDGALSLLLDSPENDVVSLAYDSHGWLWAGCSPDGILYRMRPDGSEVSEFRTGQSSIWCLTPHGDGVAAGTGPSGKIYYADGVEEPKEMAMVSAANAMSLLACENGDLIVATESPGLIQRISDGETFTVVQMDYQEVRNLHLLEGDSLAFVALSPMKPLSPHQAAIYTGPQWGPFELLWESPDSMLLDLSYWGDCLVGVGGWPGRAFCIEERNRFRECARVGRAQILESAVDERGRLYFGAGSPAALYWIESDAAGEAEWISPPLDATTTAQWGRVTVMHEKGKKPVIWARSGNLDMPEIGWSPWTRANFSNNAWSLELPTARYAQIKLELHSDGKSSAPLVDWLEVSYLPANHAPEFKKIQFLPRGKRPVGLYGQPTISVAAQTRTSTSRNGKTEIHPDDNPPEAIGRYLIWEAADADGDNLIYSVNIRHYPHGEWYTLEKDLEETYVDFAPGRLADGWYHFRITADDRPSNSEERARTVWRDHGPVLLDETPPRVSSLDWKTEREGSVLVVKASDEGSGIVRAAVSIDGGHWSMIDPVDGMADSESEIFEVPVGAVHVSLSFRLHDRAGNISSVSLPLPE